jgi:hypothetical protein
LVRSIGALARAFGPIFSSIGLSVLFIKTRLTEFCANITMRLEFNSQPV